MSDQQSDKWVTIRKATPCHVHTTLDEYLAPFEGTVRTHLLSWVGPNRVSGIEAVAISSETRPSLPAIPPTPTPLGAWLFDFNGAHDVEVLKYRAVAPFYDGNDNVWHYG